MFRSLVPITLFAGLACTPPSHEARLAELDAAVNKIYGPDAPGAAILVAQHGQVVFSTAVGLADLENAVPLDTGNVFRIGSVTKQFTAVAILQLADAGRLRLEDEVTAHIDFPRKEHPITIEHLLTHTSGIPNYTDLPSFTPEAWQQDISAPDMIALFANEPLEFEPGTKWRYSNSGYILLGAIIEKVSGLSWSDYMARHILSPAGMEHSSASLSSAPVPGEVHGYSKARNGYALSTAMNMTWPYAAGSIRSTVRDLWKWNTWVFAGQAVPRKWLDKAHTGRTLANGKDCGYGYGWEIDELKGHRTVEHEGAINGFMSASLYVPDADLYVVVLSNREEDVAEALASKLASIML